jgi:hypothetical protein
MDLTAENVMQTAMLCMYPDDTVDEKNMPADAVLAAGITIEILFDPARLAAHTDDIGSMLDQLPATFKPASQGGDGGWSFLKACNDAKGNQWGEQKHMETLFMLGIAVGKARWMFPRRTWPKLPGGMPYVIVSPTGFQNIERHVLG